MQINKTPELVIEKSPNSEDEDVLTSGEQDWTTEEETAVRRRLDLTVVPLVVFLYMLCAIDRANVGNARIQGMQTDLKLAGSRYNIVLTIFFVCYLIVEVPSNIILKYIGPRFYIPFLVLCFGIVTLCTSFVKTYPGLAVARAVLGIFEGGAVPATAFFLSCFYKKRELFFRMSVFIASSALSSSLGGLLAAGLSRTPSWGIAEMKIQTWRNIFFFEGLFTILIALAAPLLLPQNPESCRFLTTRQRYIAAARLRCDITDNSEKRVTWPHIKLAIFNLHTNICALSFFCTNSAVQGMGAFIPTILREFGWTSTKAQLYSVPPYLVACCITIAIGHASDRAGKRGIFIASILPCSITGFAILRFSDNIMAKYAAVFLNAAGVFAASSGFLSWGINNAGSSTAAAVAGGYMVMIASSGGVLSTWTYLSADAPLFHAGHTINLCLQIFCFVLTCMGLVRCAYINKARDDGKHDHLAQGLNQQQKVALGHGNPDFRYML